MPMVKTIKLDGSEAAVKFPDSYPYYMITNMDSGEIYVSGNPDIVPYADGVYTVLAGAETRISPARSGDTVYLLGSGTVQIRAEEIAVPTSFKRAAKGGGGNLKSAALTLLKAAKTESEFQNGLTGFELVNELPSGSYGIAQWNSVYSNNLGVFAAVLEKAYGLAASGGGYIDSAIFSSIEEIDLTDYSYVLVDFCSASNYGNGSISNYGGVYFRIDAPEELPQSKTAYDWNGWDSMAQDNCQGLYCVDIFQISGKHKLCFGVHHGTYNSGYSNALAILNIILF